MSALYLGDYTSRWVCRSKGFRRTNHTSAGPDTDWKRTNHSSEGPNTTCDINIPWDNWSKAAPLSARPRHRAALACYHHSRLRRRSCVPVTFLCSSLPPPPPGSAFSSAGTAAMLDVQKALLYISQSTVVWKEPEGGRLP
ncbi:hypothetical protein ANANG_G00093960 [Anguilla anguilla]|uniref:Uncharacterized protein n=1 Tax=Anguilla anguilla TaxID=7936 RepID=A0A9D3S1T4_ANGAN|nr:hypothetical protein ANANG_G00093960 [Anguilla anguilla]